MILTYNGKIYKVVVNRVDGCFGADCGYDAYCVNVDDAEDTVHMNSLPQDLKDMVNYYAKCGGQ